ncbi:MAG: hypothetical protein PVF58_05645 [Candidatus Methanofastidiosia archaeon]
MQVGFNLPFRQLKGVLVQISQYVLGLYAADFSTLWKRIRAIDFHTGQLDAFYPHLQKGEGLWGVMLYTFDEYFEDLKKKIENFDNRGNSEIILKFFDQLFAEGLSKPKVLKYGFHLKCISKSIDFNTATKEDIVQFLSELEQSDFAEQTKRDYKVVLRRLFCYLGKEELVEDVKTTLKKSKRKLPEILKS